MCKGRWSPKGELVCSTQQHTESAPGLEWDLDFLRWLLGPVADDIQKHSRGVNIHHIQKSQWFYNCIIVVNSWREGGVYKNVFKYILMLK